MPVNVTLIEKNGRVIDLGKFNKGKKNPSQIATTCIRRYKRLFGSLSCGDWILKVPDEDEFVEFPCHEFFLERKNG